MPLCGPLKMHSVVKNVFRRIKDVIRRIIVEDFYSDDNI